jgi:hypothetical protein
MARKNEELDDDLELEDYESDDEVTYEDDDEDLEEPEEEELEQSPRRNQSPNQIAQLRATISELQAENKDLNKRLGNATEQLGKRLKAQKRENEEWLERIKVWHEAEMEAQAAEAFAEGVASVEKRLLPLLGVEEKAEYLEDARLNQVRPSPRPVQPLVTSKPQSSSDADDDINDLVEAFVAQGVPVDQLEQSSAKAVAASAAKFFKAQAEAEAEEKRQELRNRDGRARVSSGNAAQSTPRNKTAEVRLAEINKQLSQLRGRNSLSRATQLLNEKKQIEAQLSRRRSA